MVTRHGFAPRTGENQPLGEFVQTGKFGRMFPKLPPFTPSESSLKELGDAMLDPSPNTPDGDNTNVPAGYTYLGQFVDHDITFDTTALQEILVDPLALRNFRTPMLDLDSIYGSGPAAQPYLYQLPPIAIPPEPPKPQELFLIGMTSDGMPNDLPRASSGLGIIGDPRNDENLIVAQMHLAFLKCHNKLVEGIKNGTIKQESPIRKSPFEEARDLLIWHYQWIVLHDFLPRLIDKDQLDRVLTKGRRYYKFKDEPFIPVEFSVAAYRLGHSMIRAEYNYNRVFPSATLEQLFTFTAKSGTIVPIPNVWIIDWRRFFHIDPTMPVGLSRKLDPFLVDPLKNVPNVPSPSSLAVRNLLRGRSLGLPSGQSVAKFMKFKPLTPSEIAKGPDGAVAAKHNFHVETPLWYYILKEAQIQGQGKRLGQVGSRILAEVFVGLLEADSSSFLMRNPDWKPTLPAEKPGMFTMADLLRFVGDINPLG